MCTGQGQSSPYPSHLALAVLNWEMEQHPRTSQHCNSICQQSPLGCTDRLLQLILPSHPSPLVFPACCRADRLQGFGTPEQRWDMQLQPQHLIQSHYQSCCLCFANYPERQLRKQPHRKWQGYTFHAGREGEAAGVTFVPVPEEGALAALLPGSR